ncbi:MAG: hypothetical protein ACXVB4_05800 [Pseudobdellovibrionaceae bacterium]
MKLVLGFLMLWLLSSPAWSALGEDFSAAFKEVFIDLRNSRGGNGDVAAGYLTLMSLLKDYGIKNHVTLLVDSESEKRLRGLLSQRHPLPAQVQIETLASLDKNLRIDFYLSLASPSGSLKNNLQQDLKFSPDAILMVQTVLGNTENIHSLNPMALIEADGVQFNMQPAGLGKDEAGIYGDFVASFLRGQNEESSRRFLLSELETVADERTRAQLKSLLQKEALQGSRLGLVYGITSGKTRPQFTSYLRGLAQREQESFCLVTPSQFDLQYIEDPNLKERIVILDATSELPATSEAGKIYILKTPNLPHPVFVGLTHYSMKQGVTPVGAGDGFMSAAIILGEPFVLTRVPWNESNIRNLQAQVRKQAHFSDHFLEPLLNSIYEKIDLESALDLQRYKALFWPLSEQTPRLTENILKAALGIHFLLKSSPAQLQNEAFLSKLGLSLKEKITSSEPQNEIENYVDFMKQSVTNSSFLSNKVKEKILNYYKGAGKECSSLFLQ